MLIYVMTRHLFNTAMLSPPLSIIRKWWYPACRRAKALSEHSPSTLSRPHQLKTVIFAKSCCSHARHRKTISTLAPGSPPGNATAQTPQKPKIRPPASTAIGQVIDMTTTPVHARKQFGRRSTASVSLWSFHSIHSAAGCDLHGADSTRYIVAGIKDT